MTLATVITLLSCGVVLAISVFLTLSKRYKCGLLRTLGFGAMALGSGAPVFEVMAGRDYEFFRTTALAFSGMAVFMLTHWATFECKWRQEQKKKNGRK